MVIEYFLEWVQTAPVSKRVESAMALVRVYQRKDISHDECEDVEAALTILLDDHAPAVRIALATAFGAHTKVPRHIVSALAADVPDVSLIVLSRSPVFHDCELIEFIASGEIDKQIAIACRPWLSASVLSSICAEGCEEACIGVLANPVADFSNEDMHALASRFGTSVEIRNLLLERTDLPAETKLLLIGKLSTQLSSFVSSKSWLSSERAEQATMEAKEKAAISFAATVADEDVGRIARSLINDGQMNVSFLLRAVCMGNISLVASVLSELSGVRFSKVEAILTKDRQSAFKAVYTRAGLPKSAFRVFACAITTWRRLLSSGSKINQERMPFLVTREILELYSGETDEVVYELMVLLRKLSAETARESAKSKAMEISQRAPQIVEKITKLAAQDDGSTEEELNDLLVKFEETASNQLQIEYATLTEDDADSEEAVAFNINTTDDEFEQLLNAQCKLPETTIYNYDTNQPQIANSVEDTVIPEIFDAEFVDNCVTPSLELTDASYFEAIQSGNTMKKDPVIEKVRHIDMLDYVKIDELAQGKSSGSSMNFNTRKAA